VSSKAPRPETWPYAPDLGPRCAKAASEAAALIRGPMRSLAIHLSGEGFLVPAPEALEHAAQIFDSVHRLPGGQSLRHCILPIERVSIACALASAVDSFEQEFDLDLFGGWQDWKERNATIAQARTVLSLMNAARREDVLAWTNEDLARHDREQGETR
jgi:hypothetical protein